MSCPESKKITAYKQEFFENNLPQSEPELLDQHYLFQYFIWQFLEKSDSNSHGGPPSKFFNISILVWCFQHLLVLRIIYPSGPIIQIYFTWYQYDNEIKTDRTYKGNTQYYNTIQYNTVVAYGNATSTRCCFYYHIPLYL